MARNERIYNLAQDWIKWLNTRRFFGRPEQKNILARLIEKPRPSRGEPDAALSADLSAFNRAVTSLDPAQFVPFVVIYCDYRPKTITDIAEDLGISRNQFYERAHAAADHVAKMARKIGEAEQRRS